MSDAPSKRFLFMVSAIGAASSELVMYCPSSGPSLRTWAAVTVIPWGILCLIRRTHK